MKFSPGDMVEIVSQNINQNGRDAPLRPGMRGTIVRLYAYADSIVYGFEIRGPSWLVEFAHGCAICEEKSIKKVPPDPGRYPGNWAKCPWQPSKSVTS